MNRAEGLDSNVQYMQRIWADPLQWDTHKPWHPWESMGENRNWSVHLQEQRRWDLITVCYKSNFWELDCLYNTKSLTVIKKLKAHLARYGIPRQIVSDNARNLILRNSESSSRTGATTSPHHYKANGKVELQVKVAKRMLCKTTKSHKV